MNSSTGPMLKGMGRKGRVRPEFLLPGSGLAGEVQRSVAYEFSG